MSQNPNHVDPIPAEGAPHAWIAVQRRYGHTAPRPVWGRDAEVIAATEPDDLAYFRDREDYDLIPIGPDGDTGTRAIVDQDARITDLQTAIRDLIEERDQAITAGREWHRAYTSLVDSARDAGITPNPGEDHDGMWDVVFERARMYPAVVAERDRLAALVHTGTRAIVAEPPAPAAALPMIEGGLYRNPLGAELWLAYLERWPLAPGIWSAAVPGLFGDKYQHVTAEGLAACGYTLVTEAGSDGE